VAVVTSPVGVRIVPPEPPNLQRAIALRAVELARADIGKGEELANNSGVYVWSLTGRRTSGPWCAAAVYTWLLRAAAELGLKLTVARNHSARGLGRLVAKQGCWLPPDYVPPVGALAIWKRGLPKLGQGHVEIVTVSGVFFSSCGGNRGAFPARVAEFPHETEEPKLLGFALLWRTPEGLLTPPPF
jgi:hypothetical protein